MSCLPGRVVALLLGLLVEVGAGGLGGSARVASQMHSWSANNAGG